MKQRLFDFTLFTSIITISAYALLLFLFGYLSFVTVRPAFFIVLFFLTLSTLIFILWLFVFRAPHIGDDAVRQGNIEIAKQNVVWDIYYNTRLREMKLRLRDKNVIYENLDAKRRKKKEIIVQATLGNMEKLSIWLDCDVTIPEDAKPERLWRKKK